MRIIHLALATCIAMVACDGKKFPGAKNEDESDDSDGNPAPATPPADPAPPGGPTPENHPLEVDADALLKVQGLWFGESSGKRHRLFVKDTATTHSELSYNSAGVSEVSTVDKALTGVEIGADDKGAAEFEVDGVRKRFEVSFTAEGNLIWDKVTLTKQSYAPENTALISGQWYGPTTDCHFGVTTRHFGALLVSAGDYEGPIGFSGRFYAVGEAVGEGRYRYAESGAPTLSDVICISATEIRKNCAEGEGTLAYTRECQDSN